jgi:tetratricopeptide (TPR) repeat protein
MGASRSNVSSWVKANLRSLGALIWYFSSQLGRFGMVMVRLFLCSLAQAVLWTLPQLWRIVQQSGRAYSLWIGRRPVDATALTVLSLLTTDLIGTGFGLSNLFWHEVWLRQLSAGASVGSLAVVFWSADWRHPPRPPRGLVMHLRILAWPMIGLFATMCVVRLLASMPADGGEGYNWLADIWLPIGAAWPFVVITAIGHLQVVKPTSRYTRIAIGTTVVALIASVGLTVCHAYAVNVVVFVVGLAALCVDGWWRVTADRPFVRIASVVALICVIGMLNGDRDKLRYADLDEYYESASVDLGSEIQIAMLPQSAQPITALTETSKPDPPREAEAIGAAVLRYNTHPQDGQAKEEYADLLNKRAIRLRKDGMLDRAADDLQTLVKLMPDEQVLWWRLADMNAQLGRIEQGREFLKRSLTCKLLGNGQHWLPILNVSFRNAYGKRAGEKKLRSDYIGALIDVTSALVFIPKDPELLVLRSELQMFRGYHAEAVADARLAYEIAPASLPAARQYAFTLGLQSLAAEKDPKSVGGRAKLREVTLAQFTKAIAADPNDWQIYQYRSMYLRGIGQVDDAVTDWNRSDVLKRADEAEQLYANNADAGGKNPYGLIDDRAALARWLAANTQIESGGKPVMVVVCTSGGGIAAAYWTALCLTEIESKCPEFASRLRIVTGASGGMLGAGLYVARMGRGGGKDDNSQTAEDVGRDSLTPVVRRMLLGDLPSVLYPGRVTDDRGETLQRTWAANTNGDADLTFADLAALEMEGKRPSLIFTPMMVEEGRPLVISNLDLGRLKHKELFKYYLGATSRVRIGTAIRMNAAFPFVTPGTYLPSTTPRRVVDAGYLDNYGVATATEWINSNWSWLLRNTGGVVIVQIRAYPDASSPPGSAVIQRMGRGWDFLATPFGGLSAARLQSMNQFNNGSLLYLDQILNVDPSEPFGQSVQLTCPETVPLGWYLTANDRARLRDALRKDESVQAQIGRLVTLLRSRK